MNIEEKSRDLFNELVEWYTNTSDIGGHIKYKNLWIQNTIRSEFHGFGIVEPFEDFENEALLIIYHNICLYVKRNEDANIEDVIGYFHGRSVRGKRRLSYLQKFLYDYKKKKREELDLEEESMDEFEYWLSLQDETEAVKSELRKWYEENLKQIATKIEYEDLQVYMDDILMGTPHSNKVKKSFGRLKKRMLKKQLWKEDVAQNLKRLGL